MDIVYDYQKLTAEVGRPVKFTEQASVLINRPKDNEEANNFVSQIPLSKYAQASAIMTYHEVSTDEVKTKSEMVDQRYTFWPTEDKYLDDRKFSNYLKNLENNPAFIAEFVKIAKIAESTARSNGCLNIRESYIDFEAEDEPRLEYEIVVRDHLGRKGKLDHKIKTISCSWSPDSPYKIAAACCPFPICKFRTDLCTDSYVWSLEDTIEPMMVLKPNFHLTSIEFNIKESSQILGGMTNGQACIFDVRRKESPATLTDASRSHKQVVIGARWIHSRTNREFMTAGADGKVLWWDLRNMNETLDEFQISYDARGREITDALTFSTLEYEYAMPAKFSLGFENGLIFICNRKAKHEQQKIANKLEGHSGPVRSIQRHPQYPKILLSTGDHTLKLWTEEVRSKPIRTFTSQMPNIFAAEWLPSRSAVFLCIREGGIFEAWDILKNVENPLLSTTINDDGINCISIHGPSAKIVACGAYNGDVIIAELGEDFLKAASNEKSAVGGMFERDIKYAMYIQKERKERDRIMEEIYKTKTDEPYCNYTLGSRKDFLTVIGPMQADYYYHEESPESENSTATERELQPKPKKAEQTPKTKETKSRIRKKGRTAAPAATTSDESLTDHEKDELLKKAEEHFNKVINEARISEMEKDAFVEDALAKYKALKEKMALAKEDFRRVRMCDSVNEFDKTGKRLYKRLLSKTRQETNEKVKQILQATSEQMVSNKSESTSQSSGSSSNAEIPEKKNDNSEMINSNNNQFCEDEVENVRRSYDNDVSIVNENAVRVGRKERLKNNNNTKEYNEIKELLNATVNRIEDLDYVLADKRYLKSGLCSTQKSELCENDSKRQHAEFGNMTESRSIEPATFKDARSCCCSSVTCDEEDENLMKINTENSLTDLIRSSNELSLNNSAEDETKQKSVIILDACESENQTTKSCDNIRHRLTEWKKKISKKTNLR